MSQQSAAGTISVAEMRYDLNSLDMISHSAEQTRKVGMRLGELAASGDVILLVGALGTGKTCLTQGIARGLSIDEYTASPSFVLVREYKGRLTLYHIDLYRLDRIEEVAQLGLDDYLYGSGVSVVEWADKGLKILPGEHLLIELQYLTPTKRKITFVPKGPRYTDMLLQLKIARQGTRK